MSKLLDFRLPKELIAQTPAEPRDAARLLVYDRSTQTITDDVFRNIQRHLDPSTTLVLNKAKVDQCRLIFDQAEVFLLETHNDKTATAMVRPGKKFKLGRSVVLADGIEVNVLNINEHGHRTLEFNVPLDSPLVKQHEHIPLPPYIEQNDALADEYQTVYAKDSGSKAAPTAGLHFTPQLLEKVRSKWPVVEVTLDVGLGTFAPITDEDVARKTLHTETYNIDQQSADTLNEATHITAVGTTSTRVLESNYDQRFSPVAHGSTDIFIQPDDEIKATNSLITNFHLPGTSLLMLVAAFVGTEELQRIYQHAIQEEYRFYSFGDAMMIVDTPS